MSARVAAAIIIAVGLALGVAHSPWAGILAVAVLGPSYATHRILRVRARIRRVDDAVRAFDPGRLHSEVDALLAEPDLQHSTLALLRLNKAVAFMMQERYAEALGVIDRVQPEHLSARMALALRTNRAWCRVHLGEVERGRTEAQDALEAARQEEPLAVTPALGTVAVAHLLAGDPAAAAPMLREAVAQGEDVPALRAVHAYYLGEALMKLGDDPGARDAWSLATRLGPGSPHGKRAHARLEDASGPSTHRP